MNNTTLPTLRQLQYLVAVSETRHFGKAADMLDITQPSLSVQLRTLEETLGVELAERGRGGVVMTPTGRAVSELAQRVLLDVQAIVDLTAGAQHGLSGTIRLGAPPTVGPYLLPQVIKRLHKTYPDLRLYVREEPPRDLYTALLAGTYDLIVTPLPVSSSEVVVERLFREPLYFACATDHPLAHQGEIDPKALKGAEVLALDPKHLLHDQVRDLCVDLGAVMLRDFEGTSLDTLRLMVGSGLGVTFLPALYVKTEIGARGEVAVAKLKNKQIHRTIGLVWRKHHSNADGYRQIADIIRHAVAAQFKDTIVL
ncbi:MAG: hydrogen peroxide-inducible genes activator [Rhodospirillaceae bacterium]